MPLKLRKKSSLNTLRNNSTKPTRSRRDEKEKGTKAGGEDKDVEVTADGEGAKTADGTTPKVSEPLETSQLGKEVVADQRQRRKNGRRKTWKMR